MSAPLTPEQDDGEARVRELLRAHGIDVDRPLTVEEQLVIDSMLYGTVCFTVDADGTTHRVDPRDVQIRSSGT